MDPKELLEHLAKYPPEPFSEGCVKLALLPFLRSLQIVGAYHEHDYYYEFVTIIRFPELHVQMQKLFLRSCGIVDTHLTSKMISSMGYDVSEMGGITREKQTKSSSSHSPGFRLKSLWSDRTYAFILVILHWANLFRCGMYFLPDYHVDFMTALIPILWFALVASCNTCMFVSCVRRDHFYLFYCKWTAIFKDQTTRSLGLRGVLNTRFIHRVVVIHWAVALGNLACIVFLMVMDDSFSAGMNLFFYTAGYRSTTVIIISAISSFFSTTTWIATTGFIVVMSHHLETHFRELSQVLQLHVSC
ncbi:unnamed protein product [Candidula unifasciata]|uniref:Uncharacterized protein n=1 Tax=Candidula unifasciata TaxID=100452 RepID=A0A8S3ZRU3_9EUPU|nr:unnamed protein product [Candidula unifasciata]